MRAIQASLLALVALIALSSAVSVRSVLGQRSHNNPPPGWTLGERVPQDHSVTFHVALKQQNLDVLEEIALAVSDPDSPRYREFMTISEINDLVAPRAEVKALVRQWLESANVKSIEDYGDSFFVTASHAAVNSLLSTDMHFWINNESGKAIVRQVGTYSVPAELAQHIDMICGLTEFPVPRLAAIKTPAPESPQNLVTIAPQSINAIYNVPTGAKNSGNSSVGVIEFENQNYSPQELSTFAQQFKVDIPPLKPAHVVGDNNPNEPGTEATLDIQYAAAVSPGAADWFWIEGQGVWLYGFATHVMQSKSAPLIQSVSYGWNEGKQCQFGIGGSECQQLGDDSKQYVQRVNTEFQKIGIRGISLVVASGDSGANGRTDPYCSESHLNPTFPAASPWVTTVGATMITQGSGVSNLPNPPPGCQDTQCASGGTEVCVSFDQARFASGGGFSDVADRPSYQKNFVQQYLADKTIKFPTNQYNTNGRGYPDVAAFGSAILIYTEGGIQEVGGTSASAPIFAGLMALINGEVQSKSGRPLGFLNPLLYKMAAEQPNAFNDITVGNNVCTEGGCSSQCQGFYATKGWDAVSGLGSPKFDVMKKYILSKTTN